MFENKLLKEYMYLMARKLKRMEIHNLYATPNTHGTRELRTRSAGHVASTESRQQFGCKT
jgi:hypothetical protein